jgi:choloylglycine hydrolase
MRTKGTRWMAVVVCLGSFLVGAHAALACTGIRIQPKDGSVICARTLEFGLDFHSNVVVIPRHLELLGTAPGDKPGLRWRSKYGAAGANAFDVPIIADGLNEKGLAVGIFYLPGYAKYQEVNAKDLSKTLAAWELPLLLLTTCSNVQEAVAAARDVCVGNTLQKDLGFVPPFHFVIHDTAARCVVLEYIDGELKVHDNPLGVLTNSPTFDWHLTNLSNYINLTAGNVPPMELSGLKISGFGQGTGMLGLPGDFTPPSRFVRAVAFSHSALPVETAREGILQAFHILNQFDIPKGAARESEHGKLTTDYTLWTSASDLKNARYYFHTFDSRRIRMVDLKQMDLDAKDIKTVSMHQEETIEDLSGTAK